MQPAAGRAREPPAGLREEEFVVVELGAQQVVHQQPPINPAAAAGACVRLCGVMSALGGDGPRHGDRRRRPLLRPPLLHRKTGARAAAAPSIRTPPPYIIQRGAATFVWCVCLSV